MTPFEYVITRRLARAHELLARTDRSALDIALGVGFKTPSHFTSRFRREFGVTPREIRADSRRPDERLDLELPGTAHRSSRTSRSTSATASTSASVDSRAPVASRSTSVCDGY